MENTLYTDETEVVKDYAVLSGGGGTVTSPAIGINNAGELVHGYEWGPGSGTAVSLTYSFPTSLPSYYQSGMQEQQSFSPFTATMKTAVREVLNSISTFANVTFTEVNGVGDLTYGQAYLTTANSDPLAWAYYPDQGSFSGDVWFNNRYYFDPAMDPSEVGYYIVAHETGHALGLVHSFEANLTGAENTEQYSVMSYDINPWGNVTARSYMLYDISAIQAIYGANTSYNSDDTTYTLDPNAAYTIWDGGGIDTFNSTSITTNVTIHLEEGGFSSLGTLTNHIAIAYGATIENATSGSGDDTLYGNAANNVLNGGAGNDALFGAYGNDTYIFTSGLDIITETVGVDRVEFESHWTPSDVSISGNTLTLAPNISGITFNDINLIEFFSFNGFADMSLNDLLNFGLSVDDIFIGTSAAETFDGNDGNDTVDYTASNAGVTVDLLNHTSSGGFAQGDTLISIENVTGSNNAAVRDTIYGDAAENIIHGMGGADILEGGAGADTIDGGDGWDYSRYSRSSSAVQINLETGINTGGDAQGDILINIEAIIGSRYNDTIIGGTSNDYLRGDDGDDTIGGGLGSDQLLGQNGNDTYLYTGGKDQVTEVGSGIDRVVFNSKWTPNDLSIFGNEIVFQQNINSITFNDINLIEFFSFNGLAEMTLSTLKSYIGSIGHNTFGTNADDIFIGTSDSQSFDGAGGSDTVDYSTSSDAVIIDLLNHTASGGYAQNDTLTSIENIIGSDNTASRDFIYGDAQNNSINGMGGADILEGGAGADIINGGDGWDYSRYIRSNEGVHINMTTGINTGGDAQGDTLINIEAIIGSKYDDVIIGGAGNDYLKGENGNDIIGGGAGTDLLFGGNGADTFIFDALSAFHNIDKIQDFNITQNDRIDIADILQGYDPINDTITEFVQITENAGNTLLSVDANGGGDVFVQIALIAGLHNLTDEHALELSGILITV